MHPLPLNAFNDNYIWVIPHSSEASFICIDPGMAQPVIDYAKQKKLTLKSILITHHHADHMGGIELLMQAFPGITVFGPDDVRIKHLTHRIITQTRIDLDSLHFETLFTPGHTSSHICFYEPNKGWLFCGDTLFSAGCGRVFDGTITQLFNSLMLIKSLPDNTLIFPAHEYTKSNLAFAASIEPMNRDISSYQASLQNKPCSLPTSLKLEKLVNPFLRLSENNVIEYALHNSANDASPLQVLTKLRELKNSF